MTDTNNEQEQARKLAEVLSEDNKVEQQVCPKCKEEFNLGENTCPHCGHTKWGIFIIMTIVGLIAVPVAIYFIIHSIDNKGVVMNKLDFFLSIIGGFLGVVLLIRGISIIWNSLIIRKNLEEK